MDILSHGNGAARTCRASTHPGARATHEPEYAPDFWRVHAERGAPGTTRRNARGQPRGGVGPTLAAQGFSNIVPLKPVTEGIENLAFNDFTTGVDTTAD